MSDKTQNLENLLATLVKTTLTIYQYFCLNILLQNLGLRIQIHSNKCFLLS